MTKSYPKKAGLKTSGFFNFCNFGVVESRRPAERPAGVVLLHAHRDEAIEAAVIHKEQMSARNKLLASDI